MRTLTPIQKVCKRDKERNRQSNKERRSKTQTTESTKTEREGEGGSGALLIRKKIKSNQIGALDIWQEFPHKAVIRIHKGGSWKQIGISYLIQTNLL